MIKTLMFPVGSCTVSCSGLQLSALQPQTFLAPQMHRSPSYPQKAFVTWLSPGKFEASASHLPYPYMQNSPGNLLSLPKKHNFKTTPVTLPKHLMASQTILSNDYWHGKTYKVSLFDCLWTSHLMKYKLQVGRTSPQLLTCHCIYSSAPYSRLHQTCYFVD